MKAPRKYYTSGQFAKAFEVAPRTACQWADKGRIKCIRVPGSLDRRFHVKDVIDFAVKHGYCLDTVSQSLGIQLGSAVWTADKQFAGRFPESQAFESIIDLITHMNACPALCLRLDLTHDRYQGIQIAREANSRWPNCKVTIYHGDDETEIQWLSQFGEVMSKTKAMG